MKLTNKTGLPDAVVQAIRNQPYSKGTSDVSATEIMDSPRIRALKIKYKDQIENDANDFCFSLMGTAFHGLLERYSEPGTLSEERLFMDVGGITISGAMDLQKIEKDGSVKILDFKVTSSYKTKGDHEDWTKQLNIYAALVRELKGVKISGLEIIAFIRDWKKGDAQRNPDYPQSTIVTIPIEVWPHEKAMGYIYERVNAHLDAREAMALDEPLPFCTDEERWSSGDSYGIRKIGGSRVTKFATEAEAKAAAKEKKDYEVLKVPSAARRCDSYCEVSRWCDQYASSKQVEEE